MKRLSPLAGLIGTCEAAIREGRVPEAKRRLSEINTERVPRELRLAVANLCRRVGLNDTGLRVITGAMNDRPTLPERAEHALLLQRAGNLEESLRRLEAIPAEAVPETLLYRSFCHFNRWEYHLALPLLQQYLRSGLDPYAALVGQVNLAAALSATEHYTDASELLTRNIADARAGGYRRLEGNCHEIQAQIHILRNDLPKARASLDDASALLQNESTFNGNAVLKWRAAIEAMELGTPEPLIHFRERAIELKDWEAFRHIDLHILRVRFDQELFHQHLFGTPWVGYREHAQRILGRVVQAGEFLFGHAGDRVVNLITGEITGANPLPFGGALHCTLEALSRDFYRPTPVAGLFSILFAGEHFDPYSSPNRVHQSVYRLRTWLKDNELALQIELENDCYRLRKAGPAALLVPYERRKPDANLQTLKQLRELGESFTLKEACDKLGESAATVRTFCKWAIDNGYLEKSGAGRATMYVHTSASRRAG